MNDVTDVTDIKIQMTGQHQEQLPSYSEHMFMQISIRVSWFAWNILNVCLFVTLLILLMSGVFEMDNCSSIIQSQYILFIDTIVMLINIGLNLIYCLCTCRAHDFLQGIIFVTIIIMVILRLGMMCMILLALPCWKIQWIYISLIILHCASIYVDYVVYNKIYN